MQRFPRPRPVPIERLAAFLGVALLLLAAFPARSQDGRELAFSVGSFDVLDANSDAELGVELRLRPRAFGLKPIVGATVHNEGGYYVFGGLRRDLALGGGWTLAPHFAITLFEEGDGRDLGHTVEFRSALEIAYRWSARSRLGLTLYHLSNGGLSKTNPGAESLVLVYAHGL